MTALPPSAGVIGWPVAHSKSPLIHRFWLAKLGIDGDYGRFPIHPDRLGEAIRALPALGLRGVNVTVPHKVAVMAHLDRVYDFAAKVGAVNTVVVENDRLVGANTDVHGILEAIADHSPEKVELIGAGGAARAVVAALVSRGITRINITNRDPAKSAELAAAFGLSGMHGSDNEPIGSYDLLINATSVGMGDGRMPVAPEMLEAGKVVFDLVYSPLETPLLAEARRRGMIVIDGLAMLIGQAAAAFALFYGSPAPREHDAELRALLTA